MRSIFQAYDRAVEFAQNTTLPRDQIPELLACSLVHYNIHPTSARELATEIVENHATREEAKKPHPLFKEGEAPCLDY